MTDNRKFDINTVSLDGVNLIEASAGTGKTFTISRLYLRLILEKGLDVREILVVTFTEAATKELIDRIRGNLRQAHKLCSQGGKIPGSVLDGLIDDSLPATSLHRYRSLLNRAIVRFDEAAIHTIHGFCRKILNEFSFETSSLFDLELINDQQHLIQEIVDDFQRVRFSETSPVLAVIARGGGLDSDGLMQLANLILRYPTAELLPSVHSESSQALLDNLEAVKSEWTKSEKSIRDILLEDKGLSRSKKNYHPDLLEEVFLKMQRIVAGTLVSVIPEVLEKFAESTLAGSVKKKHEPPTHPFFRLCELFLTLRKRLLVELKRDFIAFLLQELAHRKNGQNLQSFDDLLLSVRDAVRSRESGSQFREIMRRSFSAVLVDEFQDTDPVQYEIFRKLFEGHATLFYIGDPKQAIYSFRGADVHSYFEASSSIDSQNRFTLDTNWRSESGLVDNLNRLFSETEDPFAAGEAIRFGPSQSTSESKGNLEPLYIDGEAPDNLLVWYLQNKEDSGPAKPMNLEEAGRRATNAVVSEVHRLLQLSKQGKARIGDRPLQPSDLAILVLKNDDAASLKDHLITANIPAVITKSGNVFQSEEADEIHKVMLAVAAPTRMVRLNTALATKMLGFNGEAIRSLIEDDQNSGGSEVHVKAFLDYHDIWRNRGFIRMFRQMMSDYQIRENLLSLPGGERRLTNILHLTELIHGESTGNKKGINGLLSWIYGQRFAPEAKEENELRLERDDQAIRISTVFKSKGLEYPIVFCPFMWQRGVSAKPNDLIFHKNGKLFLQIDADSIEDEELELVRIEELSDKLRLLYVALTRARNRCYLVCGKIGARSVNAIDYILNGGYSGIESGFSNFQKAKASFDNEKMRHKADGFAGKTITLDLYENNLQSLYFQQSFADHKDDLNCRTYSGSNPWLRNWGIASYSRFVSGESYRHETVEEKLLLNDETETAATVREPDPDPDSFFTFPRGRVPGTCVHAIFEKIDYTSQSLEEMKPVIAEELIRYNLLNPGEEESGSFVERVLKMIGHVLQVPLGTGFGTTSLSEIGADSKLVEFEFHYPIGKLSPEILSNFFKKNDGMTKVDDKDLSERIAGLGFHAIEGFMHGYIDLIFNSHGRYYIIDWKTNYLGSHYGDYSPERLDPVMKNNFYDLQYYIYIVALNQYLTHRLPHYRYEEHFGGVFYLFVRGIHPDHPGCGVYADLPSKGLIDAFSRMIRTETRQENA